LEPLWPETRPTRPAGCAKVRFSAPQRLNVGL